MTGHYWQKRGPPVGDRVPDFNPRDQAGRE